MMKQNNLKRIMITVNGKPVGNGLLIDKVTYAPVASESDAYINEQNRMSKTGMN
ncbi:hypothetical protein [Paenibacillus dakarensis]|uniref:hypothetical protein n=1 Tax=Paenibacillus dakarensis TaxID=1527293 RepID=UPI000B169DEA|nr:hypothetical protein [Paenibacillus dakarensis]